MTDDTTPEQTSATFVCPVEDCRALIPDTIDDQRAHRRGHDHRDKVDEAVRTALRLVKADFGALRGDTRDAISRIEREVAGVDRQVRTLPAPPPPTQVRRGGWDDDDLDSAPAADVDADWADLLQPTPEPETAQTDETDAYAGEPDEDAADDDDDEDDPHTVTRTPVWAR